MEELFYSDFGEPTIILWVYKDSFIYFLDYSN